MANQTSTADKLKVIEREIAMRKSLYPRRVRRHEMSQLEADYQIEVMEAILDDYQQRARHERHSEST
jgi:hypothetical protein